LPIEHIEKGFVDLKKNIQLDGAFWYLWIQHLVKVLAMITSQKNPDWTLDTKIAGNRQAGLTAPSKVRMKLFTLDNRLIVKKIGALTGNDKKAVIKALQRLLALN